MALKEYNKKRNFKITSEPEGKIKTTKSKNLFVIQKHAASHLHYDFRLELNGVLLSWAVPKGPCLDPTVKRLSMQTEDHPIAYGSFEGLIPKGEYGGGTVMLWDTGSWVCENENPLAAVKKGHLTFTLNAKKLRGRWHLVKFKTKSNKDDNAWFLIKGKDKYAKSLDEVDITLAKPNSVISKLSLDEIKASSDKTWTRKKDKSKNAINQTRLTSTKKKLPLKLSLPQKKFPLKISPQLATLVDEPPIGEEWIHEIKFDGYRMLAFIYNNTVRLMSRNNKDWTTSFQQLVTSIKTLKLKNCILDGEIVLLDDKGKSDFQRLQNSFDEDAKVNNPYIYYVFDLLYIDCYDLRVQPLKERKQILRDILPTHSENIRYSEHVEGRGNAIFKKSCELGLEGIICKDANSHYIEKRSKSWLKVKCLKRQELVIGGFTKPQGVRNYFGSLFLGYYNDDKDLIFCGNVGTGFTQASLKTIHKALEKNITTKNPFHTHPPGYKNAIWVKPRLVCEVEFTEWTEDGSLRHPSFKGLREDKKPKDIIKEVSISEKNKSTPKKKYQRKITSLTTSSFQITHPEKILYPEDKITKLEVLQYYQQVSKWILPYIINRPLTLVRCPENYKKTFYQKHTNNTTPNTLFGIDVSSSKSNENFLYIKDAAGLMALVQMSVLEIHPWGSTIHHLEQPDMITFDIDPSPEVEWEEVVATAFRIKEHLAEFKLTAFVKTTGGKGLHVAVPILPKHDWLSIKQFAHVFVDFMVRKYPKKYVSQMSKLKRKNKIFLDYLRNQKGATAVSAYSSRARPHAPVSTPIAWEELSHDFADTFFTITTLPGRLATLKKDPWEKFFKLKQSLKLENL